MKLQTSFVKSPANLIPALSILNWGAALLMLLMAVYLVYSGYAYKQENVLQQNQLQKLQTKLEVFESENARKTNQLTLEQFDRLKQRVTKINQLTEFSGQDISLLLSELEKQMPDKSYLVSLSYRSLSDELILVVESADVAKLTLFIDRLETSGLFREISIVRQDNVKHKGHAAVQFEVHLKNTDKVRAY